MDFEMKSIGIHKNPIEFIENLMNFLLKTSKNKGHGLEDPGAPHFSPIVASWNPIQNASFCQRASFACASRPTLDAMKLYGNIASSFWRRFVVFARSKKISWGIDGIENHGKFHTKNVAAEKWFHCKIQILFRPLPSDSPPFLIWYLEY